MRKYVKRALVAIAGSGAAVVLSAAPAFAGTITSPSSPFVVPECTSTTTCTNVYGDDVVGAPEPFNVTGSGWTAGTPVFIEICNGLPPTAQGWSPTVDCDNVTSPTEILADSNGNVSWDATNTNDQIGVFRGEEAVNDLFNCVAPGDIPSGATQNANGSWNLPASATTALDGESMDPSKLAWTNCQVRMSSNNGAVTSDQTFITLSIPNSPQAQTPESPVAILLPIGAVGVLGGGLFFARRRRHARVAAAA